MKPALSPAEARDVVVRLIGSGSTVAAACEAAGRSMKWYENLRSSNPGFKQAVDDARAKVARAKDAGQDTDIYQLSFVEFRKRYLGRDTYPHQQAWIDVLEGKEPVVHPSTTYTKGSNPRLLCVNTPPFHAKSVTITGDYVVYKLCMNLAFRVMIISKTRESAGKFLQGIRTILTSPDYAELQAAYAPNGNFKPERGEGSWSAYQLYIGGRGTDAVDKAAKDPSVTAMGIGGQVYGSRADLIILDDAIDDGNASAYEKQFDWLTRTVMSRGKSGKVILVGTRVAPHDLYSHILDGDNYVSGHSPWTYLAQPAVLEFAEDPADWVTLWPRSSQPLDEASGEEPDEDGMFTAWDGPALSAVRESNRPGVWALVYMQQQVSEDMTFHPLAVHGSTDKRRKPGPLRAGALGHPRNGAEGMQVVGSIDPAGTGEAFMLVYALDRVTKERWVLNAWTGTNTKPSWYLDRMREISPAYGVQEWVIESNAYASWLIHDEAVVRWSQETGVRIIGHFTGGNKQDPDFGVATMANLFGSLRPKQDGGELIHAGDNIIHLPDPDMSPGVKALVDQLLTWVPGRLGKQLRMDGPMALWFAELRARTYVTGFAKQETHTTNRFTTPRALRRRGVVTAGY